MVKPTYVAKLEGAGVAPGIDLVGRLAKALETLISDLMTETGAPDSLPLLREQRGKLSDKIEMADKETFLLLVPLLARLLESPHEAAIISSSFSYPPLLRINHRATDC